MFYVVKFKAKEHELDVILSETGNAPGLRLGTRLTVNTPKTNCELTMKSSRLLVEPRRRSCFTRSRFVYNSLLPSRARVSVTVTNTIMCNTYWSSVPKVSVLKRIFLVPCDL